MASVAKFKQADTPRLLSHCNRTQKNQGMHIDQERTCLNYNLAERDFPDKTDYQFLKSRIHQDGVRMLDRKNVNAACSWVVTYPKDMCHEVKDNPHFEPDDPEECRKFFQNAYDFLAKQHGAENVVSAYVHMDENMPHMHFIFTPIVRDKKRGGYKVSAKEALHDCYGAKFQVRLQEYISEKMGRDVHMVRKENVDYEKNVRQLKKHTLNAKVASLDQRVKRAEEELDRKKRAIRVLDKAMDEHVNIKATSSGGYTVLKDADWQQVQKQLKALRVLRAERREIQKELDDLENSNFAAQYHQTEKENERLRTKISELEKENENLRLEAADLNEFVDRSAYAAYKQSKENISR